MCSKGLAKIILFLSNFFLLLAGGLLLGLGIYAKVNPESLSKNISNMPTDDAFSFDMGAMVANSANLMIVVGCFLFVFCSLGCLGGCCQITWMLFLYWVALLIIIILEIALIIFAAVSPGKMKEEGIKLMKINFLKYTPESIASNGTFLVPNDPSSLSWFAMQSQLDCCGVESKTDYNDLTWKKEYEFATDNKFIATVPPSCCMHMETQVTGKEALFKCMKGDDTIHSKGCYQAVEDKVKKASHIPIIICVVVIFIELISIAAAIYLWRQNKSEHMSV